MVVTANDVYYTILVFFPLDYIYMSASDDQLAVAKHIVVALDFWQK